MPAAGRKSNRLKAHDTIFISMPSGRIQKGEFLSYSRGRAGEVAVYGRRSGRMILRRAQVGFWEDRLGQRNLFVN